MAVRVVVAAVLSALLMFTWGFVFWGPVMINATSRLMAPLPPEAERDVLPPLRSAQTPDGMYVYPGPPKDNLKKSMSEWEEKLKVGPVIHMAYHREGVSPMDPMMFAKGLAHNFVVALLAGILLATVVHALPSYASRVGVLALVGLIAAIWTNVASVIWWFHPPRYAAGQIVYELVAGLLMALATAAIIRPRPWAPYPADPLK